VRLRLCRVVFQLRVAFLFELDGSPYEYEVARLEAELEKVKQEVKQQENSIELAKAVIASAKAEEKYAKD